MSIQFWMIPIICAVLMLYLSAAASAQTYTVPESPSVVYNFNLDWKFHKPAVNYWPLQIAMNGVKDAQGRHFYDPDYDDSAWEDVSLPHTFNDVDSFRSVARRRRPGCVAGDRILPENFLLPESFAGRKVFIEFEGVRQAAYVYLNGVMVGYYEAGSLPSALI